MGVETSRRMSPLFGAAAPWVYSVQPAVLFNVFFPAVISGSNRQLLEPGTGQEQAAALLALHWATVFVWMKLKEAENNKAAMQPLGQVII